MVLFANGLHLKNRLIWIASGRTCLGYLPNSTMLKYDCTPLVRWVPPRTDSLVNVVFRCKASPIAVAPWPEVKSW
jgi:hypothetical protein